MRRLLLCASLIALAFSGPAHARSPSDLPEVHNGLLSVIVGAIIQHRCDTIRPRYLRVLNLRARLMAAARDNGFTDDEIDAYTDDPDVRARMGEEAAAYLAARGATKDDVEALCAVGKAEIAANSTVGRLLRAR